MNELNSIERVMLTIRGRLPDRVPVDLHNFLVTARWMGVTSYADYFRDGEAMAEGQIKTWKRFGHDCLIIENGTAALGEACGVHVTYQDSSAPVALEPAIHSLDEVDSLVVPDPYRSPVLVENLKTTRLVAKAIGKRAFIIGRGDQGPFSLACQIRGMDQFMLDLMDEGQTEKVNRLLDFCRQVSLRYCLAQIEQGAHATSIGESPSGPDLISPKLYRKFAYPHVKRLVDDLKAKGVVLAYHICGNATPIIQDMVSSGATILEIDQKADMRACKSAAQGKTTLLGPVDPSAIMANGTPQEVTEHCRQAIEVLAPGGGFILGPGCALPATTPDENIDAMIEAVKVFGRYN
jgi:uroporphyrinogen decarboxylase